METTEVNPIKRHSALINFSREHHFGLLLVWKIKQAIKRNIEAERISNYALFFFERDLQNHLKKEEITLFAKLPEEDDLRQQAIREHGEIYSLINNIREDKKNIQLLNTFADALEKHIRFEERSLFNHLQNKLSEAELAQLAKHHSKQECNIDESWSDHFWNFN